MQWLIWIGGGAALFGVLSLMAVWAYGRFARKAQGLPSRAIPAGEGAWLDDALALLLRDHPHQDGMVLLSDNLDAFAARVWALRKAERSFDVMYYIWQGDLTGRLLLAEVLAAADRGVRVRMLLDDVGVGQNDPLFQTLDSHPLIDLRLFNPTRARGGSLRRGLEMALRAFSVTRRMHNKLWLVDGRLAILGGRNIGDAYFDAAETSNFRDLDLMLIGPMVGQAAQLFDDYWNSGLALPVRNISLLPVAPLGGLRAKLSDLWQCEDSRPYLAAIVAHVGLMGPRDEQKIFWTEGSELLSDPPEKALGLRGENWLMTRLRPTLLGAKHHLQISSPYFVPGPEGTAQTVDLVARGVKVEVLTNSLAATDVAAVHGGYAPYRRALLEGGVELYELRPTIARGRLSLRGKKGASLHTKAFSIDKDIGFIGSLNFDPRSQSLNTEMGVLFRCAAIVAEMRAIYALETTPEAAYKVSLIEGRMIWTAEGEAGPQTYDRDPHASWGRRLLAWLVGKLPLESQL